MKKMLITALAVCLYHAHAAADTFEIPAECKNLAVMQAQLLTTRFTDASFSGKAYNPSKLTLRTNNGFKIGQVEYLGGDSVEQNDPNYGKYPCDLDASLCTNPANAGGAVDWARVTVTSGDATPYDVAQVVVSMGSRGGCAISSAKSAN